MRLLLKSASLLFLIVIIASLFRHPETTTYAAPPHLVYLPRIVNPTGSGPGWLSYFNQTRALGSLPPVTEDTTMSHGDYLHAYYMVKTDTIGHTEDPASPYYTPEGNAAAQRSNTAVFGGTDITDNELLNLWVVGPFHAVGLFDPSLLTTGYGSYREADGGYETGAALNIIDGLGTIPSSVKFPIRWPDQNKDSWFTSYNGGEFPDPLTACPGYTAPSGAPIYLMVGDGSGSPTATNTTLTRNGQVLTTCTYSETNYVNPNPSTQALARNILGSRDAVVIIPKAPLTPGTYQISVTVNGQVYNWSFNVVANAPSSQLAPSNTTSTVAR